MKQIAKNSKRAIRCHPGGGGRRPADGSDDLMIESHSPISWRPPCRHTSPPARPAWLSAPAARGRPSLDQRTNGFSPRSLPECGFFRRAPLCCRGGRRLLPAPRRSLAWRFWRGWGCGGVVSNIANCLLCVSFTPPRQLNSQCGESPTASERCSCCLLVSLSLSRTLIDVIPKGGGGGANDVIVVAACAQVIVGNVVYRFNLFGHLGKGVAEAGHCG